jgi:hypothetical protein
MTPSRQSERRVWSSITAMCDWLLLLISKPLRRSPIINCSTTAFKNVLFFGRVDGNVSAPRRKEKVEADNETIAVLCESVRRNGGGDSFANGLLARIGTLMGWQLPLLVERIVLLFRSTIVESDLRDNNNVLARGGAVIMVLFSFGFAPPPPLDLDATNPIRFQGDSWLSRVCQR